jgi:hypothetical protein
MQATETLKAPATRCRYCGTEMPAQPSSPGRPQIYCSRRCRRAWHVLKETYEKEREAEEVHEREYYAATRRWWDKRTCDKRARERAERAEERERIRQQHLEAPYAWRED